MSTVLTISIVWCTVGVVGHWYWPMRYWRVMKPNEWLETVATTPLYMLFGPFAYWMSMPV